MKKKLKDYLHLYLGCECMIGDLKWKREEFTYGLAPDVDLDYGKPIRSTLDAHVLSVFSHKTTLILRPLSDMTEHESRQYRNLEEKNIVADKLNGEIFGESVRYLLSKGFDLFGLIEAGLAIDATTLKAKV